MLTAFSRLPEAPQSGNGCSSSLLPIFSPSVVPCAVSGSDSLPFPLSMDPFNP